VSSFSKRGDVAVAAVPGVDVAIVQGECIASAGIDHASLAGHGRFASLRVATHTDFGGAGLSGLSLVSRDPPAGRIFAWSTSSAAVSRWGGSREPMP
jgi:hypothetical protein